MSDCRADRSSVDADSAPAALLGIEHEFRILDGDVQLDFRRHIHDLGIRGRRLDPADPNAYRCEWGGAITADGREAEVAIPPVRVRPGFVARVAARARSAEGALRQALPAAWRLEGYSTHISVSAPSALAEELAPLYARTFGPALMLFMERATSPGLLVRPRPGRLELCAEQVDGHALRAAVAFAVGSVIAISRGHHPAPLRVDVVPAIERYGWYVDRRAFGCDLSALGRDAPLRRERGGTISAQAHLEASWSLARRALWHTATALDMRAADALARGEAPLPLERASPCAPASAPSTVSSWGLATRTLRRPTFTIEPRAATWEFAVYAVRGARTAYLAVPSQEIAWLVRRLPSGALDGAIEEFLRRPGEGSVLTRIAALAGASLCDEVVPFAELAASEREPDPEAVAPTVTAPLPWWSVPVAIAAFIAALVLALRSGSLA